MRVIPKDCSQGGVSPGLKGKGAVGPHRIEPISKRGINRVGLRYVHILLMSYVPDGCLRSQPCCCGHDVWTCGDGLSDHDQCTTHHNAPQRDATSIEHSLIQDDIRQSGLLGT
jgi:hypothetical protein